VRWAENPAFHSEPFVCQVCFEEIQEQEVPRTELGGKGRLPSSPQPCEDEAGSEMFKIGRKEQRAIPLGSKGKGGPEGAGAQGIDKADVWVAFRPPQAGARLLPAWLWTPSLWP